MTLEAIKGRGGRGGGRGRKEKKEGVMKREGGERAHSCHRLSHQLTCIQLEQGRVQLHIELSGVDVQSLPCREKGRV